MLDRVVNVFAVDSNGRALVGADIQFFINGQAAGGVTGSDGRAHIQLDNRTDVVSVTVTYAGESQSEKLGQNQDTFEFRFAHVALEAPSFMEKHLALFIGLALVVLSVVLAFFFKDPSALQTRIILAVLALGGGAVATEITGMLKVDLNLGQKLVVAATGALAIFVILYLVVPA
ncbi:hypothetical protein GJW-30_1_02628 [Variibacter gotjawalensis]|uniref:Big-1 domain-containing protein n=1 Tax=Variibacter gotjawalensis TaxID=1333996 RepID=A0A0S3PVX1_9BRAD|nr:Ig-like domain-containing protein [Variibacter gotjawalensis]NIK45919.1 hypothetical protein [Variibacter gotjawalensis]RZS47839.1 hypothetical protein EV661_0232 [Variibacter gotjawalensis]BAT60093.1 hypothetical protein GJW-30_1_02628 [Variibacter gotjawalensis]